MKVKTVGGQPVWRKVENAKGELVGYAHHLTSEIVGTNDPRVMGSSSKGGKVIASTPGGVPGGVEYALPASD